MSCWQCRSVPRASSGRPPVAMNQEPYPAVIRPLSWRCSAARQHVHATYCSMGSPNTTPAPPVATTLAWKGGGTGSQPILVRPLGKPTADGTVPELVAAPGCRLYDGLEGRPQCQWRPPCRAPKACRVCTVWFRDCGVYARDSLGVSNGRPGAWVCVVCGRYVGVMGGMRGSMWEVCVTA
jgi:hypothetical protein